MKKRINLLYMIMALVTIVASVSIACTVFYNVLKHEVLEDMHNYIDVFIGAHDTHRHPPAVLLHRK